MTVENRGNGHIWRMPANLIAHISAILYAGRGDRRKSQSLHRAHLAIFADRRDRRIKSPSVSLALDGTMLRKSSHNAESSQILVEFLKELNRPKRFKKLPKLILS